MDFAIVDLQGFKDNNNKFIVKEFALFTKNIQFHDIIKSSSCIFDTLNYSSKQSVEWLKHFHHGLDWNDGYITVDELRQTVAPILRNKLVYVKGLEKIEWLHQLMSYESSSSSKTKLLIVNAEDLGCNLNFTTRRNKKDKNNHDAGIQQSTAVTCSKHRKMNQKKFCCALQNAINLKLWYFSFCKRNH